MGIEHRPLIGCQITDGLPGVSTSGPGIGEAGAARQKEQVAQETELSSKGTSALLTPSDLADAGKGLGEIAKNEGKQGFVPGVFKGLSSYSSLSAKDPELGAARDIATEDGGARLVADLEDQMAFEAYMKAEAAQATGAVPDRTGEIDLKSLADGEFMALMRDDLGPDFWDDIG